MDEVITGKTMTDEEARDFIGRARRLETDKNPIIYVKAVKVALYELGYDRHWVYGRFSELIDKAYGVKAYKKRLEKEARDRHKI